MKKYIKGIIITVMLIAAAVIYSSGNHDVRVYSADYDRKYNECRNTGIVSEGTVQQSFIASKDSINGLAIKATLHGDLSKISLKYKIVEAESKDTVANGEISAGKLKNDKFYREKFETASLEKGKTYTIILKEEGASADSGMGFYYTPAQNAEETFVVNENSTAGTLVIRTIVREFQTETFVVLLLFMLYISVFLKILYKLFK